jgi:hypothetical protein
MRPLPAPAAGQLRKGGKASWEADPKAVKVLLVRTGFRAWASWCDGVNVKLPGLLTVVIWCRKGVSRADAEPKSGDSDSCRKRVMGAAVGHMAVCRLIMHMEITSAGVY